MKYDTMITFSIIRNDFFIDCVKDEQGRINIWINNNIIVILLNV